MSVSLRRFGHFLLVIGIFFLVLFFASDQSDNPQFGMFFGGALLSLLGGLLSWKFRSQPTPSERFRTLRRMRNSSKKKK
jgi:hypothetical protein